jgi:hypothetical protein
MGNEGSVPQGTAAYNDPNSASVNGGLDDAEGLEYQARAPPSSINPSQHNTHPPGSVPSSARGSNGSSTANAGGEGGSGGHRSGRPLIGAVFTRRGNAHNQNSTGIERPVQTAASYPPPQYHHSHVSPEDFDIPATDSKGHPTRSSAAEAAAAAHAVPMPGEELTYMSPTDNSQHYQHHQQLPHQQLHHPSGQPPPQQPLYMQQQQHASAAGKQHVVPNQQYYSEHRDQNLLQQQQQHHNPPLSTTTTVPSLHGNEPSTQHAMNGGTGNKKGSWRQKGIMGSMRNLSLGNSIRSAVGGATSPSRTSHQNARQSNPLMNSTKQVNNWELQWDADDDDEDDEEEEEGALVPPPPPTPPRGSVAAQGGFVPHGPASAAAAASQRPGPIGPPQMTRHPPDLDSGFAAAHPHGMQQQHQQQQQPLTPAGAVSTMMTGPPPSFVSPGIGGVDMTGGGGPGSVISTKAHLVTATPEMPHPPSGAANPVVVDNDNNDDDDGVEWDTGMVPSGQEGEGMMSDKPSVEQFLPLLRVLGKGSFGKVCVMRNLGESRCVLFFFLLYLCAFYSVVHVNNSLSCYVRSCWYKNGKGQTLVHCLQ